MSEVIRCVGGDTLRATLYAGVVEGELCLLVVLEVLEAMRCLLLCILEAVEGWLCSMCRRLCAVCSSVY